MRLYDWNKDELIDPFFVEGYDINNIDDSDGD